MSTLHSHPRSGAHPTLGHIVERALENYAVADPWHCETYHRTLDSQPSDGLDYFEKAARKAKQLAQPKKFEGGE